jgi:hypothetical protein
MKTYFISGHGNIHFEEWITFYKTKIDNAIAESAAFIIGDFRGTDVLSAEYLKNKTEKVTITHCFKKSRYKVDVIDLYSEKWIYKGGFESDEERDKYMTLNSDEDIAWFREGRESSGTAKNIQRRLEFNNPS